MRGRHKMPPREPPPAPPPPPPDDMRPVGLPEAAHVTKDRAVARLADAAREALPVLVAWLKPDVAEVDPDTHPLGFDVAERRSRDALGVFLSYYDRDETDVRIKLVPEGYEVWARGEFESQDVLLGRLMFDLGGSLAWVRPPYPPDLPR